MVVLAPPDHTVEELRTLTDKAWDFHHAYENRARITLGKQPPCPVCRCAPEDHDPAGEEQDGRSTCRICRQSAMFGQGARRCTMNRIHIALAYADHARRHANEGVPA